MQICTALQQYTLLPDNRPACALVSISFAVQKSVVLLLKLPKTVP
jgi:hypothetical protein